MKHPIYEIERSADLSEMADRRLALSRIGIATTDSTMNIDLQKCGYRGLFEQMALISEELTGDLMDAELAARRQPDPEIATAKAYLTGHAGGLEMQPPATLIGKNGEPTTELLTYCKEHGVSLDLLFPSDPLEKAG